MRVASLILIACSLAACGGGGGGGGGNNTSAPTNSPPALVGDLTPSFPENSDIIFFLSVQDADGDTVTVTIGNSADGQFFTLDTSSGEIRSTQQFDFENPQDVNGDNVYVQTVTLNDGTVTVTREVRITITNIDEPPTCNATPDVSVDENVTGVIAQFTGTDPDAGDASNAFFDTFSVSDGRVDGLLSINSSTGEISIDTGLDAEAYEDGFTFTVTAQYRTNNLFDQCLVNVTLNNLPAEVTSGILFDDNLKNVQVLTDLDGNGAAEFWMADASDPSGGGGPAEGTLVYGETFSNALSTDGAAEISVAALVASQRLRLQLTVSSGSGSASSLFVQGISDMDGDAVGDLLVMTAQPPNDGLDPTRRPWGYVVYASTIAAATGDTLNLNSLSAAEGFSLTGPVDFNGGIASYVVADLDGVAGDEIAISLPDAISPSSESGAVYVIDGAALIAASGNLDFDLEPSTRRYLGSFDISSLPIVGRISLIGDLDSDGVSELTMRSGQYVAVFPSTNLIASSGGTIESLDPLLLDLEGDSAGALGQADVDGDAVADLLLARGDGAANTKQATLVFGDALAPIVSSDSTVAVNTTNFATGDFVDVTSSGRAEMVEPSQLKGVGDLDGDGLEEVVFSLLESATFDPGLFYIIRGSALSGLASNDFNVDSITAAEGLLISSVPRQFTSLSTRLSLTPDIDGDGLQDFYLTSNQRLASDPPGVAIIIKSGDIVAALTANTPTLDLEALFFDETPTP